jgi:hypothetical protein
MILNREKMPDYLKLYSACSNKKIWSRESLKGERKLFDNNKVRKGLLGLGIFEMDFFYKQILDFLCWCESLCQTSNIWKPLFSNAHVKFCDTEDGIACAIYVHEK